MTTITLCPVLDCPWSIDTTPPDIGDGALAGMFGWGVMAATHRHTVAIDNERKIEAHLKSHTVIEWVNTINALREALAAQVRMTVEMGEAFTSATRGPIPEQVKP